jgi:hypothetical protein
MIMRLAEPPADLITSPGVCTGIRTDTLCRLVGVHLARGEQIADIQLLARAWASTCMPPLSEQEVCRTVQSLAARHQNNKPLLSSQESDDGLDTLALPEPTPLPTLEDQAYYGLAGEIVRTLEPQTEAAPAGVLLSLLTGVGSAVGRDPYFVAGGDEHHTNAYLCLVGPTSAGKGQAWAGARYLRQKADPVW